MNKRKFIWVLLALVCAGIATYVFTYDESLVFPGANTETEVAEAANKLGILSGTPPPSVAVPIPISRPIRLAIGSLGLDDEMNHSVSDLTLSELTGARGLELIERQSLDIALHELHLNLSGLVRAKDAVKAGKFLKADWFLLGTSTKFAGSNSIIVRLVDAHTGILRDVCVVSCDGLQTQMASDIAGFVQRSRMNAVTAKSRLYLSIGEFQDFSVNNRQAAFPSQLRGYLLAAYQNSNVTLLEREYMDALFQEVRLDLAGLTEDSATNAPQPMQSAYWFVEGSYQSYETTNFQVGVVLKVSRPFGLLHQVTFQGEPDETLFKQIKTTIDSQIAKVTTPLWPTRNSEARAQFNLGKE